MDHDFDLSLTHDGASLAAVIDNRDGSVGSDVLHPDE
jgi:hypothetical protein